jgi:hypothetical protein
MSGSRITEILALHEGYRMPLVQSGSCQHDLQSGDIEPDTVYAGMLLYLGDWNGAHSVAQDINSAEGSYWHAIVHRQEPDAGNANYWFRQTGQHAIFPRLQADAADLLRLFPGADAKIPTIWSPPAFIDLCERASDRPGSDLEQLAIEIQHAEWRLLIDYCRAK